MSNLFTMAFGSGDPRTFTGLSPTMLIFVRVTDGVTIAPPSITEALTGSGIYKFTYTVTQAISFLADAATTSPGSAGRYVFGQIDPSDRIDDYGTSLVALGTSSIALGTTSVALGITSVAIGTTLTGYGASIYAAGLTTIGFGTSTYALGLTLIGYGSTSYAIGLSNSAVGLTLIGYGSTNYGYGVSIYAGLINEGTTLVAIGNTAIALGMTAASAAGAAATLAILIGTTTSAVGNSTTDPGDIFGYIKRVDELLQGNQTFTKGSGVLQFYDRTGATLLGSKTVANNASLVTRS